MAMEQKRMLPSKADNRIGRNAILGHNIRRRRNVLKDSKIDHIVNIATKQVYPNYAITIEQQDNITRMIMTELQDIETQFLFDEEINIRYFGRENRLSNHTINCTAIL